MSLERTLHTRRTPGPAGSIGGQRVRVRDVQKAHITMDLPGDTECLLVPNDLWTVQGPCLYKDGFVTYHDHAGEHIARTRPALLRDCNPGDRVLIQYDPEAENEWWLCSIEAIDGDDTF